MWSVSPWGSQTVDGWSEPGGSAVPAWFQVTCALQISPAGKQSHKGECLWVLWKIHWVRVVLDYTFQLWPPRFVPEQRLLWGRLKDPCKISGLCTISSRVLNAYCFSLSQLMFQLCPPTKSDHRSNELYWPLLLLDIPWNPIVSLSSLYIYVHLHLD